MAEVSWIKLSKDVFTDEKMRLIDAMPDGDKITVVWIRLLVLAGRNNANGYIYLDEDIPYTNKMLANLFSKPIEVINIALKTLVDLGMIKIDEDNYIKIIKWEKHQKIEGMDRIREGNRKRAQKYRDKKKKELLIEATENSDSCEKSIEKGRNIPITNSNVTVTVQRESIELEEEQEEDIEERVSVKNKQKNIQSEKCDAIGILEYVEKLTGERAEISQSAITIAVDKHGKGNFIKALDQAILMDKLDINYINGILGNWLREGYPIDNIRHSGKGYFNQGKFAVKDEFRGFKPQKPKRLSG